MHIVPQQHRRKLRERDQAPEQRGEGSGGTSTLRLWSANLSMFAQIDKAMPSHLLSSALQSYDRTGAAVFGGGGGEVGMGGIRYRGDDDR